jgi:hypothetical protein
VTVNTELEPDKLRIVKRLHPRKLRAAHQLRVTRKKAKADKHKTHVSRPAHRTHSRKKRP